MRSEEGRLTIGALAKANGVGVETIRFYQREGLLPTPPRPFGGIRRYGHAEAERLRFVKRAQRVGFSLDEIRGLLQLEDGTHCSAAAVIAATRLADVRAKLADLRRMEAVLSELVNQCRTHRGNVSCPLITALQSERKRGAPE